jgi:hypothetical protein
MVAEKSRGRVCGLCGEHAADLAHGRKIAICGACLQAGLVATLERSRDIKDGETMRGAHVQCSSCEKWSPPASLYAKRDDGPSVCSICLNDAYALRAQTLELNARRRATFGEAEQTTTAALLAEHFEGLEASSIVTASRTFPQYVRADLIRAIETLWHGEPPRCVGAHFRYGFDTMTYAALTQRQHDAAVVAPIHLEAVDVGEAEPVQCPKVALWLGAREHRFALLLAEARRHGERRGWQIELCVPAGPKGEAFAARMLRELELELGRAVSYRGKVLSLECEPSYRGMSSGNIIVHRLPAVTAEELILPERTLALLERNVFGFFAAREKLTKLGMPMKKGLLFYGPPGTGKTHSVRYIAHRLPTHTTLLVTAAEVAVIGEYLALARLLSPSIVVIEDVDLIARDRDDMQTPGQESLLNRLLNEMDGLRENSDVLFVLTTNRAEALEPALAGRPGRIDQAIEFPLPDPSGRRRLVELYRHGLVVPEKVLDNVVERTEGASAAFIRELMRRTAQFVLEGSDAPNVTLSAVDSALGELLFDGGSLNAKLLGAEGALRH